MPGDNHAHFLERNPRLIMTILDEMDFGEGHGMLSLDSRQRLER